MKSWREKRSETGSFYFVDNKLKLDESAYRNYRRMDTVLFEKLLCSVKEDLERQNTRMRDSVTPAERLSATLRFLATGETYKSTEYQTQLSSAFLCKNIPLVCESIWKNLKSEYLKFPNRKEEWIQIADKYTIRWQFPHCLGALDGKHINFKSLKSDGGFFYNYKGTNSIILLALVDADCKFIFVDIGCNGRTNDAGALFLSDLQDIIDEGDKHFPQSSPIGNNRLLPYVIVGDDAFPLNKHIMKPYSFTTKDKKKRIFNARLSRA